MSAAIFLTLLVAFSFAFGRLTRADAIVKRRLPGSAWAGRLALPAPDDEQCRRRRAMLDASGRPDPTSIPGCGTDESAQWDPVRCGWVRERYGEFMPWRPSSAPRLPDPGPGIRVTR